MIEMRSHVQYIAGPRSPRNLESGSDKTKISSAF